MAITGGTSGLGLALVRELRHRGSRVAFVARGRDAVRRVASEHADLYGIVGDVSKKEDIYPIAVQILGGLGGLDVLINNASHLGPTSLALLADTDCEDVERALATNVLVTVSVDEGAPRRAGGVRARRIESLGREYFERRRRQRLSGLGGTGPARRRCII